MSQNLGSQTVTAGSINRSEKMSQTLNMIKRALMTPDELKSMPKGQFIIMKTGCHPMKTRLSLYFEWGIKFDESRPFVMPDNGNRKVLYTDKGIISNGIKLAYPHTTPLPADSGTSVATSGGPLNSQNNIENIFEKLTQ